jgi:hypothetical protein
VWLKFTAISDEFTASISRVEEYIEMEVLPSHKQMFLLFNSQHVSALGYHQVILRNTQLVTDYQNYSASMEFVG